MLEAVDSDCITHVTEEGTIPNYSLYMAHDKTIVFVFNEFAI